MMPTLMDGIAVTFWSVTSAGWGLAMHAATGEPAVGMLFAAAMAAGGLALWRWGK